MKPSDLYNIFYREAKTVSPELMDLISSDPLYLEKRTRKEDTKNPAKLQLRTESDIIRPNVVFRANGGSVHYYTENAGNSVEDNKMTSSVPQVDSSTVIRVTPAPSTQTDANSMFTFSSLSTSSPNYIITDDESSTTTTQQTVEDGDLMNTLDNNLEISDLEENTIDNDLKDSKHFTFLQSLIGYGKHPLHLYYTPLYPVNTYFYIP